MIEIAYILGILLALGAAISVAITNLLIRKGSDGGRAYDAVFIVIAIEVIVLTPPIVWYYYPAYQITWLSVLSFILAGLTGTVAGQIFHFVSIGRIGASRTAPIVASWALVSTVLGVVLLGEEVTPIHAAGVVFVVIGVAGIAWETSHENPDQLSRRELAIGLLIPLGAVGAYGLEPIFAKVGFGEGTPAAVGLILKTGAAMIGFSLYLWWRHRLPELALLRTPSGKWYGLAGITTTLFLIGYYGALAVAPVSIVAPIIVSSSLFVVIFSALFMPRQLEHVTWRLFAAVVIVVVGVVIITAFSG